MSKEGKIRKTAKRAVVAMSQADRPTRSEFQAAWEDGLIDVTTVGMAVIRKELYGDNVGPLRRVK